MESEIILIKSWPIILSVVCVLTWLIRLEAKVVSNEKTTDRIDKELSIVEANASSKIDILSNSLNEIRCSLSRIEGALSKSIDIRTN